VKFLSIFKREHASTPAKRPDGERAPEAAKADARWLRMRAPEREADRVLSTQAQAWMRDLPPRVRPIKLCKLHPRIINRLALTWRNVAQIDQIFEDLLLDRRGDRRGFPAPVVAELTQLREFSAARRTAEAMRLASSATPPPPDSR
jgi:hypothetical protein